MRSSLGSRPYLAYVLALWFVLHACSREHIDHGPLLSEEDRLKIDLERTKRELEAKLHRDPADHRSLYLLGRAYERENDWVKMAYAIGRASELAPDSAYYLAKLGQAQLELGRTGQPEQFELARITLRSCCSKNANIAECHRNLGEAEEYLGEFRAALESYTAAIEREPTDAKSYLALAQLYFALRFFAPAESVLHEGAALCHETESSRDTLAELQLLSSRIALVKHDSAGQISALEQAIKHGDAHPEYLFELGLAYASAVPPQQERSTRLLASFMKRCCRTESGTERFAQQCRYARDQLSRLGNLASHADAG